MNPNHDPKNGQFTFKGFHGSPNSFDTFDLSKSGTTTDAGYMGSGIYLSTDPRVAASAKHQYEAQVILSKPLQVSQPDFRTDKRDIVRAALKLPRNASAAQVTAAAKSRGYDGVVLDYSPTGYDAKEIVAFNNSSVKITKKK